jgi:histidyl-tRNA synthetase
LIKCVEPGTSERHGLLTVHQISFDMSLARGLDYYTGIIYEAVVAASAPPSFAANATSSTTSEAPPAPAPKKKSKKPKPEAEEEEEVDESQVGVGSIAAGGRYDNLVGSFTSAAAGEGKKVAQCPCIGVSIGLDRIFALVWPKWVEKGMRSKETMAYVVAVGDGLLEERIKLVQELRAAGIKVWGPLNSFGLSADGTSLRRISLRKRSQNIKHSLQLRKRMRFLLMYLLAARS